MVKRGAPRFAALRHCLTIPGPAVTMTTYETITLTRTTAGAASQAEFVIPRKLLNVRLVREIGRGGMGVVWLGRDELLNRDVAAKFLLNMVSGADDPGFQRFIGGARAAAAVRHPGLTAIHHADLISGLPYLIMEYVRGPTLSHLVRRYGALEPGVALAATASVGDAIAALHEQRILHRDIKPANVLLDDDGNTYVTDFGLACPRPSATAAGGLAGTPAYMAPEMFDGVVTERGDVYALGVMLYQLLTGRLPYEGTLEELRRQHRDEPLPCEPLRARKLNDEIIDLLQRATNKDAVFRYKSALHFAQRLRSAVDAPAIIDEGCRALGHLVARHGDEQQTARGPEAGEATPSSYYATLAARAARKRGDTPTPHDAEAEESPPPSTPDASRTLERDIPCAACDYNLHGLRSDGKCPECGEPVEVSLRPGRLMFTNPGWLKLVLWGTFLVLFYCAASGLIVLTGALIAATHSLATPQASPAQTRDAVFAAIDIAQRVGLIGLDVLLAVSVVLLTNTIGDRAASPTQKTAELVTRTLLLLWLLSSVLVYGAGVGIRPTGTLLEGFAIGAYLLLSFALLGLVWFSLREVAMRVPDSRLARRLTRGLVIFAGGAIAAGLTPFLLPLGIPTYWWLVVLGLASAVFIVCTAYLAWCVRARVRAVLSTMPTTHSSRLVLIDDEP